MSNALLVTARAAAIRLLRDRVTSGLARIAVFVIAAVGAGIIVLRPPA